MKKLIFENEDFMFGDDGIPPSSATKIFGIKEEAARVAQAKHDAWLKELMDVAKVVHGYVDEWSHRDFSTLWLNQKIKGEKPRTHKALLIDVKKIEKKPCEHKPAHYENDDAEINCKYCGAEIVPTGWTAKEVK